MLSPVGNIAVTVRDSIVLGSNPATTNPGLLVLPPNTASLSLTRTDQTSTPDALFANPGRRNYHLRADAPVIDKGQVTASDSPTDVDGQPRTSGAASDLGADEFVNTPPTAKIAMKTPSPRAGQPVTLDGSESSDRDAAIGGPITEYRWTFGDGVTQKTTTPTVEHAYGGPGAVVAELVVADGKGGGQRPGDGVLPARERDAADGPDHEAEAERQDRAAHEEAQAGDDHVLRHREGRGRDPQRRADDREARHARRSRAPGWTRSRG